MVIFRLHGSNKQELSTTNKVEGFALDESERRADREVLTMRQALFLLIQEGYERIMERRRREGVWNEQRDSNGRTCFQLQAMNGSPSMITYWRETVQGGQRMFQNTHDESAQTQPPTSAYNSSISPRNTY